jgi:pimeloyl-ACP methyl ester carboxylesterase
MLWQLVAKNAKRLCLTISITLVLLWLIVSYVVVSRATARAEPIRSQPVPEKVRGTVKTLQINTRDGERLGAWFIEGREELPLIVLLHGNGGSRASCLDEGLLANQAGYSVLMLTLRAHGDSTGELNDFGYSSRLDAIAAVEWAESQYPTHRIVVWGQSLGAAAAVFASRELGTRVDAYILECMYRDLPMAAWNRCKAHLPPVADLIAFCGWRCAAPLVLSHVSDIAPIKAIDGIPPTTPILILAGTRDSRVTVEEVQMVHERVQTHAELALIEGDHLNLARANPKFYRETILTFLGNVKSSGAH